MRSILRHFLIPYSANSHRAKALHVDVLLVYILFFALFNFGFRTIHNVFPSVLGYATDIRLGELLDLTNQKRQKLGLTPLRLNEQLSEAAGKKAQDMFAVNYWSHTSPTGTTPWVFITSSGYEYALAGENLAKNFSDSEGVVDAWMASQTHKDNIVKPGYRDVGFAIVNGVLNGEETTLVVQMFGATKESQVARAPIPILEGISSTLGEQSASEPVVAQQSAPQGQSPRSFSSVIRMPRLNIPTVTRDVAFIFLGFIIGILIIDGLVISRKGIVRTVGHNVAHIMFLGAVCIALIMVKRGVLL